MTIHGYIKVIELSKVLVTSFRCLTSNQNKNTLEHIVIQRCVYFGLHGFVF